MVPDGKNLTKKEVAERLQVSVRTVDRLRKLNLIPWFDLKKGNGTRPIVRFRPKDVEAFEASKPLRKV